MIKKISNRCPGESKETLTKIDRFKVETWFWVIFSILGIAPVAYDVVLHQNQRNPIGIMFLNTLNWFLIQLRVYGTNTCIVRGQARGE